jgi:hypothetical protein
METLSKPGIDFFILSRFEPKVSEKLQLFTQVELVHAFPTESGKNYNFIQRARLGLKLKDWQFGLGADFNEFGNKTFVSTNNTGIFLRHEF